jgi:hypothetical protein
MNLEDKVMKIEKLADRHRVTNAAFLFGVILLSTLPNLSKLGFYCDDWSYLAELSHISSDRLGAEFLELSRSDPSMIVRPVQVAYLVLGFKAFGQHPLPYHVVNAAVLGLVTVCLYFTLKELRIRRWLAFTIALVFGLLPHYSTDRLWTSSQQATLCMAFALAGIYALSRSARLEEPHSRWWLVLAVLALTLSILSYEVALGLIVASLGLIGWRRYRDTRASSTHAIKGLRGIIVALGVLLLAGILKILMQRRLALHHYFLTRLGVLTWHAIVQSVRFNLWIYGLHMPSVLASLWRHSAFSSSAVWTAAVIACLTTAYLWRCMEPSAIPSRRTCLWLIVIGFVVFGLGFALLFPSIDIDFCTAGLTNHMAIASAIGASCVTVAMVSLACSLLKSKMARALMFAFAIGMICGANSLAVSGITYFWADAASQQAVVLKSVASDVRSLPQGSMLLLDGFCRYSGPGVVFETRWDATGALQLALDDDSFSADIISANTRFRNTTVDTTGYGGLNGQYAYGDHLFVYNMRQQILTSLSSKKAADAYLRAMNPTGDSGCPAGQDGYGTKVF